MKQRVIHRPFAATAVSTNQWAGLARAVVPLFVAAVFSQCTAPISVRAVKPEAPAAARPASTAASLLASIRQATDKISRGDDSAVALYNHDVARLVEQIEFTGLDPWSAAIRVGDSSGSFMLRGRAPAGTAPLPAKLILTDTLGFHGKYAEYGYTVPGIGAPLVAVTSLQGIGHEEFRSKLPVRNLTAIVRFEGRSAVLELVDPYQVETVRIAGREQTLAADHGAAIKLACSKVRVDKLGLVRLLRPSRYDDTANLNFLQPYDSKRIPVLFVHGLQDTPASFTPLYLSLLQDPEIRRHCQFWAFSYPSGYPYPYSASLLRRELDDVAREFPGHRGMVIVGHSMGSLISRLMVTNAGDHIWRDVFGNAPGETRISGHSKDILLKAMVFEDRKEIDRAIFIAAPHRGSILASNWVGRIGSRLVELPGFVADVRNATLSAATADVAGLTMGQAPNSIGTLSPNNPFVIEINKLPIVPRVPYHTIVGDRGKGDTPDSSDGVVAYWSSHLEGAASEKIVPSGHSAHQDSQGIEEVRRILHLHLGKAR